MAEFVEFPSTMWTAISHARRQGGGALDLLLRKYRPVILAFVRNAGFGPEDAEDVTQEVFLALVRDDVLAKADRVRGKFRSLLLAVTRHTISTQRKHDGRIKRGGGARRVSLEAGGPDGEPLPVETFLADTAPDDTFDPLWIQNLVRLGMDALETECTKEGTPYYRALAIFTSEGLGYPEIADRLGVKVGDVKNYIHQARLRLRSNVLREVQAYSSSRDEYEAEIAALMKYLD
ncbi:MAG: sigma-70 family RNA polymerase sigma factor [Planctomycetes bacterium]|nr:sigma-70 family RNA polymerase sigma factor [Planctomycetota bacterium]